MDHQEVKKVKIAQAVNSGVVTYLEGIRGFIPASQLSLNYVEDLESWVNKEIEVIVNHCRRRKIADLFYLVKKWNEIKQKRIETVKYPGFKKV
jgi:small subunit ribosomal protein S1